MEQNRIIAILNLSALLKVRIIGQHSLTFIEDIFMLKKVFLTAGFIAATSIIAVGCSSKEMSFKNDIAPIIQANCIECHISPDGAGYKKSGLELSSYEGLMAGTTINGVRGAIIIAGNPASSTLLRLVEGKADPSIRMPHNKKSLKDNEITALKMWVEQGAKNN